MKLKEHLDIFYRIHNIPENGGIDDKTFEVPLPFFKLILPNFGWRKSKINIHDIEHILNKQDTSWKGEIFIASYEIAAGFWRHFPITIFPFWTMGYGCWNYPRTVYHGFIKGLNDKGILALKMNKEDLLELELRQLQEIVENRSKKKSDFKKVLLFIFSVINSQIIFLLPAIILIICGLLFLSLY